MPAGTRYRAGPLGRDVLPQVWVFAQLQRAIGKLNVRSPIGANRVERWLVPEFLRNPQCNIGNNPH
jgi:hypothetical protein